MIEFGLLYKGVITIFIFSVKMKLSWFLGSEVIIGSINVVIIMIARVVVININVILLFLKNSFDAILVI